jgi:integrase
VVTVIARPGKGNPKNPELEEREQDAAANEPFLGSTAKGSILVDDRPAKTRKPKNWRRGMGNVTFGKHYGKSPYRARYIKDGKPAYRYFTTEDEAWTFLKSDHNPNGANSTTVGQLLEDWFNALPSSAAQKTLVGYRGDINLYLNPAFGTLGVRDLTTDRVLKFFLTMKTHRDKKKPEASTVHHINTTLSAAFSFAASMKMVPANPFINGWKDQLSRYFPLSQDYESFSREELDKILAYLDQHHESAVVNAFFRMGAMHGLRLPGEARGLRWQDFNPKTGVILLWGQLGENAKPGDLKTESARPIELHPDIVELLKQVDHHRGEWKDYIFLYPKGHKFAGRPFGYTFVRETFRRIVPAAGVDLKGRKDDRSPHSFRHTVAELLAEAGYDKLDIQHTGGWKSGSMVDRYIGKVKLNRRVGEANRKLFPVKPEIIIERAR